MQHVMLSENEWRNFYCLMLSKYFSQLYHLVLLGEKHLHHDGISFQSFHLYLMGQKNVCSEGDTMHHNGNFVAHMQGCLNNEFFPQQHRWVGKLKVKHCCEVPELAVVCFFVHGINS